MAEVNQASSQIFHFIALMNDWREEMANADDRKIPCHCEVTLNPMDQSSAELLGNMAVAVLPLAASVSVSMTTVFRRHGAYGTWCILSADYQPD